MFTRSREEPRTAAEERSVKRIETPEHAMEAARTVEMDLVAAFSHNGQVEKYLTRALNRQRRLRQAMEYGISARVTPCFPIEEVGGDPAHYSTVRELMDELEETQFIDSNGTTWRMRLLPVFEKVDV